MVGKSLLCSDTVAPSEWGAIGETETETKYKGRQGVERRDFWRDEVAKFMDGEFGDRATVREIFTFLAVESSIAIVEDDI